MSTYNQETLKVYEKWRALTPSEKLKEVSGWSLKPLCAKKKPALTPSEQKVKSKRNKMTKIRKEEERKKRLETQLKYGKGKRILLIPAGDAEKMDLQSPSTSTIMLPE